MAAKSTKSEITRRDLLHAAYFHVVNNFAVGADDVALDLHSKKLAASPEEAAKLAKSLLGSLRRKALVDGTHVNGESALTWQSMYDIENTDEAETIAAAQLDFDNAFPEGTVKEPAAKSGGATGPRYSESQLTAGAKARAAGLSNKAVAEAAGVKSPSYFAKVLKQREVKAESAKRAAKKSATKKSSVKS